ncbi:ATPase associated with various cellular activities, AAA_5 [Bradyrhizobium sp. ORS 285]|uniref:AAA family ATPase n=1 Tax=Bradyrhizobium sp. ORS 285 TaxID=115808 RepID=UPI0002406254|nr:AAA family ATPase [Bradyrhizobium sp. ORS 285]CCD88396.1 ATPase associated with various cellular activities, AAA_5 [Bradyrhizobium sp. ORS 285]SMX56855.1 ATPase associated with various cellular activities, AAA_5 [Bradyrhizobium sp. ORS 285]
MVITLNDKAIHDAFNGPFQAYRDEPWAVDWRKSYVAQVELVRRAERAQWLDPAFQRKLWDDNPVANIGPGRTVNVEQAYTDVGLSSRLLQIRDTSMEGDLSTRGRRLQEAYDEILGKVYQVHTKRRPMARLVRLMAAMFPRDMTCLMDGPRVWATQRLIGAPRLAGDFIAQHAAIRQRIRDAVGDGSNVADEVDQSIFAWFLWSEIVNRPDEGAVTVEAKQAASSDIPSLSLLPPNAQRRSLACMTGNVSVLVAVVREAENGITREDLINVILSEAPQINAKSAAIVISQATGGLGLIHLVDGAFRPTQRGLELLFATEPEEVLRAPLIGRVFGMGQLLLRLSKRPEGIGQMDAARWLQTLVPTWTTTMPGSHIIVWAKVTGLVRSEIVHGSQRLYLTDDGQTYVSALPADFEERWKIDAKANELSVEIPDVVPDEDRSRKSYDANTIIADGCFLDQASIERALRLLQTKKNLVLQGPPGTGKTWLAKRLGYALIGEKDDSRLMAVQFQPSLSYEDFVRGYRPDGSKGLELVDGTFLDAIEQAKREPKRPYVLVIEEINRGNPAQIFGELLTLLEWDKRKKEEGLRLAYPRGPFEQVYVPENLYVIGTMNLADRSLALVDLALRRRFAFLTLEPSFGAAWQSYCKSKGAPDELLERVRLAMAGLNQAITQDLGSQFNVGHSFLTPPNTLANSSPAEWKEWVRDVIGTEIKPLLLEYWYDDKRKAEDHVKTLESCV